MAPATSARLRARARGRASARPAVGLPEPSAGDLLVDHRWFSVAPVQRMEWS